MDPKLDVQSENELLSAVRLLVSEDQCNGRFVFNRQVAAPSKKTTKVPLPGNLLSGGGGDNSKNQLQALLARAGHEAPTYKTRQLRNNQFRSTVIFNGLNFDGQPCSNKKLAEKDAAAEALLWLKGESQSTPADIDHMSMLLKKSKKKDRKRSSTRSAKWG